MPEFTRLQAMQASTENSSLHLCHSWDDSGGNAVRALVIDQQNRVRPLPSPWKPCVAALTLGAALDEALDTKRAQLTTVPGALLQPSPTPSTRVVGMHKA